MRNCLGILVCLLVFFSVIWELGEGCTLCADGTKKESCKPMLVIGARYYRTIPITNPGLETEIMKLDPKKTAIVGMRKLIHRGGYHRPTSGSALAGVPLRMFGFHIGIC